ncbi:hypothetical protein [Chitinophaga pinensis]|uniref:Tetratricopeptide repeat protein n=1 Tax=Chitinophaga pinensis TaxID=79329 RepID=A0A5C6LLC7_9BACT|nr:hypothetical protein [Chitinophaga pinensis]TWV90911.1 hypothetical protein FEF09_29100 [Chitinophaga pinensis]
MRPSVTEMYAKILLSKGDYDTAYAKLSKLAGRGLLNPTTRKQLEEAYTKVRGGSGFQTYLDSLKGHLDSNVEEEMANRSLNSQHPTSR